MLSLYLKLKVELVKYGGLSKSLRFRQLLTSFMAEQVISVPGDERWAFVREVDGFKRTSRTCRKCM